MNYIKDVKSGIHNGHRFDIMEDIYPENNIAICYFAYIYENDKYDDMNETFITIGGETMEECEKNAKREIGDGKW